MPDQQQGFAVGVDLGTSNTVAVLRWPDGRTRPLLVDGAPIMPSGVYADPSGQLLVGRDAQRLAGLDPARFEPNPKRRIDEAAVLLGDREIPVVDLLAALLQAVGRAAVEAVGFLPQAILTYPAAWGQPRRDILANAARRAGWPPVRLVPEPVAAARYFADVLHRPVPVSSALAVFDFGGGTLDIAVVRNDNGRFTVIGTGGIEDLGGLDVDSALVSHLGGVLAETAPDTWHRLAHPDSTTQRRDRRLFWEDVRGAKEMLSRTTVAPIGVPGRDQAIHLTREELERVAEPLLRRAVWETGAVLKNCGLRPDQLAGLFLVGGSSRLPLAARLLHSDLGVAPTVLEQPELPVAEGALAELAPPLPPQGTGGGLAAAPVSPGGASGTFGFQGAPSGSMAFGAAPVSTGAAPASAGSVYGSPRGSTAPVSSPPVSAPTSGVPTSGSPYPGAPVSASPYPGAPVSGPRSPAGPPGGYAGYPPQGYQPAGGPPLGNGAAPALKRSLLRRPIAWIGAVAVLLVVVLVVGFLYFPFGGTASKVDFKTLRAVSGASVAMGGDGSNVDYAVTAATGSGGYYAWTADKALHVGALNLGGGKAWGPVVINADFAKWSLYPLAKDVVLVAPGSSDAGVYYVLDAATGEQRFHAAFNGDDHLYFFDNELVQYVDKTKDLVGHGWSDGKQKWTHAAPKDANGYNDTTVYQESIDSDFRGATTLTGQDAVSDLSGHAEHLLQIGYDKQIYLLDAGTGNAIRHWANVGDSSSKYVAHDGKLFVVSTSSPYSIQAYDLTKQSEPQTVYTAPDEKLRLEQIAACGNGRLCVLDDTTSDGKTTQLVVIDIAGQKQLWRKPAVNTSSIIPVGDQVLATTTTDDSTPASVLYKADGSAQLLSSDDLGMVGVRVNAASLLLFAGSFSSYSTSDVSVIGVTAASGAAVALGPLQKVRGTSCSWNDKNIVCATQDKIQAWTFV